MSIIKCRLKKIEDIVPWGNAKSGYYMHWFGLTDSYYWLALGQNELLRYSDEFVKKHGKDTTLPYVDYQYARIYDDFFSILDKVITPIPCDIFSYIGDMDKFDTFRKSLRYWINEIWNEEDEQYDKIYLPSRDWIYSRKLDSGYLVGAPDIYFFACDSKVYIRWYCDYEDADGIKMWKESRGEYVLSYSSFIEQIKESFELFWSSMDERVEEVTENWTHDSIYIDKKLLVKNHTELKNTYKSSMKYIFSEKFISSNLDGTDFNWENVKRNIKLIVRA